MSDWLTDLGLKRLEPGGEPLTEGELRLFGSGLIVMHAVTIEELAERFPRPEPHQKGKTK